MNNIIDFINTNWWILIWIAIFVVLISLLIMSYVSRHFRYDRWTSRTFTIMDLEFPSSGRYYTHIMISLRKKFESQDNKDEKPLQALKTNLYWDFIFMVGLYPLIALLGLHIIIIGNLKESFIIIIMLLSAIAWILDIIENIIILKSTIKPKIFIKAKNKEPLILSDDEKDETCTYRLYKWIVNIKWLIAIIGIIFPLLTILYLYLFKDIYSSASALKGFVTLIIVLLGLVCAIILQGKNAYIK